MKYAMKRRTTSCCLRVVRCLTLTHGADVKAKNSTSWTALQMVLALATDSRYTPATELGMRNQDMTEWLRQHGGRE